MILLLLDEQKDLPKLVDSGFYFVKNTGVKKGYDGAKETYNELYSIASDSYKEALEHVRIKKENAKLDNRIHQLNLIQIGVNILAGLLFIGLMSKNLTEKKTEDEKEVIKKKKIEIEFIGEEKLKHKIEKIIEKSFESKDTTGILLHGPPGTGKTELMKYIINKLDLSYHIVLPSDILNKYFGESEANLKRLIEKAKNYVIQTRQSYVLIFDECEALFGQKKDNNNETEVERNLKNMMLQYMSGEMSVPGLVIVGITNHIDFLEPAFVRSGRFSHKFYLANPDAKNR